MKDNISPEEKLLKLIRGKKNQGASQDKKPLNPIAPVGIDSKTNFRPHLFFQIRKYLPSLSLKKIILIFFAASCIYLTLSFIYPWAGYKKDKFHEAGYKKIILLEPDAESKVRPYEFYLEGVKNKKIFSSISEEQETEKTASRENLEQVKDISLVGIIAGEDPQAVIEDKKAQKTYYVTKGESVGVFQVKEIQEGKVVLNYKGQNYELHI